MYRGWVISVVVLISALSLKPSWAIDEQDLRAEYEVIDGHGSYKWHTSRVPWESAQSTCVYEGANLWVINSQSEWSAVQAQFGFVTVPVGVHRVNTGGAFVTVLGQPLEQTGYATWQAGQPGGDSSTKPYVFFSRNQGLFTASASDSFRFICEKRGEL